MGGIRGVGVGAGVGEEVGGRERTGVARCKAESVVALIHRQAKTTATLDGRWQNKWRIPLERS